MTNSGQARQAARLLYRNPKKIRNKVGFLWDKYIPCLACPKTTKTGRFSMVQIGNFLSYHDNITNMRHIMNRTEICKRCGKSKADLLFRGRENQPMSNTNSTATTKKNAVNAPQIIESKNPSNHPTRATSLAREGAPAIYRVVLRRLIDANDEERREHWEMCRDFERNGESVPDEREKIGQLLYRQCRLLEALKEYHPDALLFVGRVAYAFDRKRNRPIRISVGLVAARRRQPVTRLEHLGRALQSQGRFALDRSPPSFMHNLKKTRKKWQITVDEYKTAHRYDKSCIHHLKYNF